VKRNPDFFQDLDPQKGPKNKICAFECKNYQERLSFPAIRKIQNKEKVGRMRENLRKS
jgi:uncharacterized protein YuzE